MRHEEDLRRRNHRPTRADAERSREAYRKLLAEAGYPTDWANPKPTPTIVMRGEPGWLSGPC